MNALEQFKQEQNAEKLRRAQIAHLQGDAWKWAGFWVGLGIALAGLFVGAGIQGIL